MVLARFHLSGLRVFQALDLHIGRNALTDSPRIQRVVPLQIGRGLNLA